MNLKNYQFYLSINSNSVLLTSEDQKIIFLSLSKISNILIEDLAIFLKNLNYYFELHKYAKVYQKKSAINFYDSLLKEIQIDLLQEIRNFKKNKIFKTYTLCLVVKKNQILLGKKKIGLGKGYYNGFGGKVEPKEKIISSAIRELYEEAGIKANKITKAGKLFFNFSNSINSIEGFVFLVEDYEGTPTETQEMIPQWFSVPRKITFQNLEKFNQKIPFDQMWEDDLFWFPFFFRGQYFLGFFELNEKNQLLSIKLICKTKKR